MKKTLKKTLSLLLTLAIVLSMIPSVFAEDTESTYTADDLVSEETVDVTEAETAEAAEAAEAAEKENDAETDNSEYQETLEELEDNTAADEDAEEKINSVDTQEDTASEVTDEDSSEDETVAEEAGIGSGYALERATFAASSTPTLVVSNSGVASTSKTITLSNLAETNEIELTLVCDKAQSYTFTIDSALGESVLKTAEVTDNGITLKITLPANATPLSGNVVLGVLTASAAFQVISASGVTITDADGNSYVSDETLAGETSRTTYYVANGSNGGSDNNDGSESAPFLTIDKAITTAKANKQDSIEIILLSDIGLTKQYEGLNGDVENVVIDGNGHSIELSSTAATIGGDGAMISVAGGTVSFENVTLSSASERSSRILAVQDGAVVHLVDSTVTGGYYDVADTSKGGAGAYVLSGGTLYVEGSTSFKKNETTGIGGAILVQNGGTLTVSDTATFTNNKAVDGGAIYVASMDSGLVTIEDNVSITKNTATNAGAGIYVSKNAKVKVSGEVAVYDNTVNSEANNVYLADIDKAGGETFDISGTTIGAKINITAENAYYYKLVSLPVDGYTIAETKNGDEAGWTYDGGAYEIRYMNYKGVPGLYLFYKTLDMQFYDVSTLTDVQGEDINTEDISFLEDADKHDSCTVSDDGVTLTVADTAVIGNGEDLVVTITCNPDEYRIPDETVVKITSGSKTLVYGTDYDYEYDVEKGTGTITIHSKVVNTLTETIVFNVTAEKYYDLTITMEGPLYSMETSVTGIEIGEIEYETYNDNNNTENLIYRFTDSNGNPVEGVKVKLYDVDSEQLLTEATSNSDGTATLEGMANKSTYPVFYYTDTYKVITRDTIYLYLTTLEGQVLSNGYVSTPENADVTYVPANSATSDPTATIKEVGEGTTVIFSTVASGYDRIYFHSNEPDDCSATAEIEYEYKDLNKDASNYGELADATMVGYNFLGWFDEDGNLVESTTAYNTGVSPRDLYAHWQARNDTKYTIHYWIETADSGVKEITMLTNCNHTYYIVDDVEIYFCEYNTREYNDGTSDSYVDLSKYALTAFDDSVLVQYSWLDLNGFTVHYGEDNKILADGSAEFNIYYTRNEYLIHFDEDSLSKGTAESEEDLDDKEVTYGTEVGELPDPYLDGYTFEGWYTEPDGQGEKVTPEYILTVAGNITVFAHWTPNDDTKYSVILMLQGIADNKPSSFYEYYRTYKYGDDAEGIADLEGLEGTTDTVKQLTIAEMQYLSVTGFTYAGYSDKEITEVTDEIDYIHDSEYAQLSVIADGSGIVYLYYTRNTKVVIYEDPENPDDNGDPTQVGDPDEAVYEGTLPLPEEPTLPGYDFDGWEDEDGNPVDENTPADDYVTDETTDEIVIHPTWKARTYILTYVPGTNGNFVPSSGRVSIELPNKVDGLTAYTDGSSVTYNKIVGTMPSATKDGYVFKEWRMDLEDALSVIRSTTIVTSEGTYPLVVKNADNSESTNPLFAYYTPHNYTIVLDPGESPVTGDEGTVDPGTVDVTFDEVFELPEPELDGYTFVTWVIKAPDGKVVGLESGDVWDYASQNGDEFTATAIYVPNEYKYFFDMNDDTGSTKGSLDDPSIEYVIETFDSNYTNIFDVTASRPGYEFIGWSLTPDGDILTEDDRVAISSDTVVYAIWEPLVYPVTLVMEGSDIGDWVYDEYSDMVYDPVTDTYTIYVVFDTTVGDLAEPTRDRGDFVGWTVDAPGWIVIDGTVITALPQYVDYLDENGITLTVKFDNIINFDPDGGDFTDDDDDEPDDPRDVPQSEIEDEDDIPGVDKDGYEFEGWTDKDDPSDEPLDPEDIINTDVPLDLIPIFSPYITFDANGGKVNSEDTYKVSVKTLAEDNKLPSASRNGYTLDGWYTEKSGGTKMTLADLLAVTEPTTVYAHWAVASTGGGGGGGVVIPTPTPTPTYTITVEDDGGIDPVDDVVVNEGDDATVTITPKPGYVITEVYIDGEPVDPNTVFSFDDVDASHTIKVVTEYRPTKYLNTDDHILYIIGYAEDGLVHPEANLTRAQMATIIYRLLTDEARAMFTTSSNSFEDVAEDAWYVTEVSTLANMGIVIGYEDGTFKPNQAITREEMITMMSRFAVDGITYTGSGNAFSDISGSWAKNAINLAYQLGWIEGYTDGTFRPKTNITRAEAVTIVNNMLGRSTLTEDGLLEGMITFPDNMNISAWYYLAIQEAINGHDYDFSSNGHEFWTELK